MKERTHRSTGRPAWLEGEGLLRRATSAIRLLPAAMLIGAASAALAQSRPVAPPTTPQIRQSPQQEHLPQWYAQHRSQSTDQQIDALRREPGFQSLPPEQQQRLIQRLQALDAMTPEERQRRMARNEAFEHLSPERKQEVRGAAQALNQMPKDRQQVVRRAFQQLRRMPATQRQQLLASPVYGGQFTSQERTVLDNLLSVEPYQMPSTIPQPYFGRP